MSLDHHQVQPGLFAIGIQDHTAEGKETVGSVKASDIHVVEDNGMTNLELKDFTEIKNSKQLLPGFINYSFHRTAGGPWQTQTKDLIVGPFFCTIDPEFVPFAGIMDNFFGNKGKRARVSWKFFLLTDHEGEQRHTETITGTNGWITNVNYSMGAQDSVTFTLTATGVHFAYHYESGFDDCSFPADFQGHWLVK